MDAQVDFMKEDGLLSVPGAVPVIDKINDRFTQLDHKTTPVVLLTFDTHDQKTYQESAESKLFPGIHCEKGTKGWTLAVDDTLIPESVEVFFAEKSVFDLWATSKTDPDAKSVKVYRRGQEDDVMTLDQFVDYIYYVQGVDEVETGGVALNFCVSYGVKGWVEREFKVIVQSELTKGIDTGKDSDLCPKKHFKEYIDSGKVSVL